MRKYWYNLPDISTWNMHFTILSGAPQNDVNARVVLRGTHHSARRMCLKSWHLLQPIANLSFVCFICQNCLPRKILSSNIISCNFIYNVNGILKSWEFHRLHPSVGKKQSIHIVSFPARCTRSRPSAGHTTLSWTTQFHIHSEFVSHEQSL